MLQMMWMVVVSARCKVMPLDVPAEPALHQPRERVQPACDPHRATAYTATQPHHYDALPAPYLCTDSLDVYGSNVMCFMNLLHVGCQQNSFKQSLEERKVGSGRTMQ